MFMRDIKMESFARNYIVSFLRKKGKPMTADLFEGLAIANGTAYACGELGLNPKIMRQAFSQQVKN